MSEETKMPKYKKSGKAYYEAHKAEILAEEKDKKRWLSYYDRNKEAVKERNRLRYYARKGVEPPAPKTKLPPAPKPPAPAPPEKPLEVKRLEELVAELRSLLPEVVKKKARPKRDRKLAPLPPALDVSGDAV